MTFTLIFLYSPGHTAARSKAQAQAQDCYKEHNCPTVQAHKPHFKISKLTRTDRATLSRHRHGIVTGYVALHLHTGDQPPSTGAGHTGVARWQEGGIGYIVALVVVATCKNKVKIPHVTHWRGGKSYQTIQCCQVLLHVIICMWRAADKIIQSPQ